MIFRLASLTSISSSKAHPCAITRLKTEREQRIIIIKKLSSVFKVPHDPKNKVHTSGKGN